MVERHLGKMEVMSPILISGSELFNKIYMATKKKPYIKMQCTECKKVNYFTSKSKKIVGEKLDLKKFCNSCRKHTVHKESKK